jgi:kynureninase
MLTSARITAVEGKIIDDVGARITVIELRAESLTLMGTQFTIVEGHVTEHQYALKSP